MPLKVTKDGTVLHVRSWKAYWTAVIYITLAMPHYFNYKLILHIKWPYTWWNLLCACHTCSLQNNKVGSNCLVVISWEKGDNYRMPRWIPGRSQKAKALRKPQHKYPLSEWGAHGSIVYSWVNVQINLYEFPSHLLGAKENILMYCRLLVQSNLVLKIKTTWTSHF